MTETALKPHAYGIDYRLTARIHVYVRVSAIAPLASHRKI